MSPTLFQSTLLLVLYTLCVVHFDGPSLLFADGDDRVFCCSVLMCGKDEVCRLTAINAGSYGNGIFVGMCENWLQQSLDTDGSEYAGWCCRFTDCRLVGGGEYVRADGVPETHPGHCK